MSNSRHKNRTSAEVVHDDLLVLSTQFKGHTEAEDKWQKETTAQLKELTVLMCPMVKRHEQTLYGETGEKGLSGDMVTVHARLDVQDKRWYKLFGAAAVISAGVTALFKAIWK